MYFSQIIREQQSPHLTSSVLCLLRLPAQLFPITLIAASKISECSLQITLLDPSDTIKYLNGSHPDSFEYKISTRYQVEKIRLFP